MTVADDRVHWCKFTGLALISLSILMLELSLTRIFSVTMWYHFAFAAISVALLGIGASGLVVFLFEKTFARDALERQLSLFSSLMALNIVATMVVVLRIPFPNRLTAGGVIQSGLIYGMIALPFFLGGLCISLLLWHHAKRVSGLYFSDLLGAAVGCIVTLAALDTFATPQVVLLAAVIAASASVCFSMTTDRRLISAGSRAAFGIALVLFISARHDFLTRLLIVKHPVGTHQTQENALIFEKWNSFSRVTVLDLPDMSLPVENKEAHPQARYTGRMIMMIDAAASTELIKFDGDFGRVQFLKHDVAAFVHWLKNRAKVLIVGPGGGRDVLAALAFGQKSITGVEINPIIVDAMCNDFHDFVGDIYHRPEVSINIDEGRSFLARSREKYDIIQASMVDTWAATSAGAFALTENNLYTIEAFDSYLGRLREDGMLTFSRWCYKDEPGETLRLTALGIESLERAGCVPPRQHLLLVRQRYHWRKGAAGLATLVLKKTPFTEEELEKAREACRSSGFQFVCSPDSTGDPIFARLFDKLERERLYRDYPLNIVPPTDDKPFFFHMARIKHFLSEDIKQGVTQVNIKAIEVLANLLVAISLLAFLFLVLPLFLFRSLRPGELIRHWHYLLYFVLIGFGFIMVEIPLIQRFTLFLGHPIYSLSVVLFSLLLSSSLGSFFTRRVSVADARPFLAKMLLSLILILLIYLIFLSPLVHALIALPTYLKMLLSVILIAPLGWLMGMPFPVGIKLTSEKAQFLIPWCWSLNGAFSVFASVASIIIAISLGFTTTMAVGGTAYAAVLLMILFFRFR